MVWPQASRLAEDGRRGHELLRKYTETAQAIMQPNAWVWDGGGGTSCGGTVERKEEGRMYKPILVMIQSCGGTVLEYGSSPAQTSCVCVCVSIYTSL